MALTFKLHPNQVLLVDKNTGLEWIYDIEDNDVIEFLRSKGTVDEFGNIILDTPIIAAIKGWTVESALQRVEKELQEIDIPLLDIPKEFSRENVHIPTLNDLDNEKLGQYLALFGAWKAYAEIQLAYIESKKSVLESGFEEGIAKAMANLSREQEKRPLKEILRAESMIANPQLKRVKQELIEAEALHIRLRGIRDAYKALYEATSRVAGLRMTTRE